MSESRDDRAGRLLRIGLELVGRVRDDTPDTVAAWLADTVDATELRDTAIILAALVPVDATLSELLAWITGGKWCTGCERFHHVEAFARDRSRPDGRAFYCRNCHAEKRKRVA